MRVLQVAYRCEIAGGERVLLQLVDALRAADHEVQVAVPGEGPLQEALAAREVQVHLVPMAKTYHLGAALRLRGILRDQRLDLVHSHGLLVNVLARLAAAGYPGVRSVSTVHLTRSLREGPAQASLAERLKGRFYYLPLDNWTARANDAVVAVSEAVRKDLVEQGVPEARLRVIRNGIELGRFAAGGGRREQVRQELGVPADAFLVGALARLSPQKDVGTLLDALARLGAEGPPVHAFVAGEGPARAALEARLGGTLGRRVRLLGQRSDVPELLQACDVLALSSRWEGLPLSVLEAMAAGRPVVATAVPGTAEAVRNGETGRLVPVGDAAALARALEELRRDPEKARAWGEAGRRRAEAEFSVEATTAAYLSLYRELMAR